MSSPVPSPDSTDDSRLPIVGENGPEIFIPLNQLKKPRESLLDRMGIDKIDAYFITFLALTIAAAGVFALHLAVIEHGARNVIRGVSIAIAFFTLPALIVHWLSRTPGGH